MGCVVGCRVGCRVGCLVGCRVGCRVGCLERARRTIRWTTRRVSNDGNGTIIKNELLAEYQKNDSMNRFTPIIIKAESKINFTIREEITRKISESGGRNQRNRKRKGARN